MTYPDAIKGLVEAVRKLGDAVDRGDSYRVLAGALAGARAALDAWDKRQPLREDAELIDAVAAKLADEFGETTWNIDPDDFAGYVRITRVLLDALDAALFGPPTKEGSRGR